jgi:hypothetical protein
MTTAVSLIRSSTLYAGTEYAYAATAPALLAGEATRA